MHVPGWHDATRELQDQGMIQMVGIVQEQHGDRARLFMQWKGMGWPLMVDAGNLLEVPYVPITLCIDENGIVRRVAPPFSAAGSIVEEFVAHSYDSMPSVSTIAPTDESGILATRSVSIWREPDRLDGAIDAYAELISGEEGRAEDYFRFGVLLRRRFDSPARRAGDFQRAVDAWGMALGLDPNNYIYRRRIEQYGPRPAKPYPFYSWVDEAREDIRQRGEDPVALVVEPGESEKVSPGRFEEARGTPDEPDPNGDINRDGHLIDIETAVVPATVAPGRPVRFHIEFTPSDTHDAHWNNEAGDLVVWIEPPPGWQTASRMLTSPSPRSRAVSDEIRRIEFDALCPEGGAGETVLRAYALYYVCEGESGACLYRRQDMSFEIGVIDSVDGADD